MSCEDRRRAVIGSWRLFRLIAANACLPADTRHSASARQRQPRIGNASVAMDRGRSPAQRNVLIEPWNEKDLNNEQNEFQRDCC